MKRCFTTYLLYCILTIQTVYAQFLPIDSVFVRTARQDTLFLLEKVYLHTDKDNYIAGEEIWMRAHVVNGTSHIPMKRSRYVYATLQDPFLKTIANIRMLADTLGCIHGSIKLPEDLPKGEYILSGYTRYMQNFGEDYFFRKRIFISTLLNNTVRMRSRLNGDDLHVKFFDPVSNESQMVSSCIAETPSGNAPVSSKENGYNIKIHDSKEKTILVQGGNYKEFVPVNIKPDYDVSFLPEGGNLVPGVYNRVAFKAINEYGQGENITGTLRDERDSILLEFSSVYRGMGMISYVPETGRKYTILCKDESGKEKRFKMPEAKDKHTLQVNQLNGRIFIKVISDPDIATDSQTLTVFAHQRGWPISIARWDKDTPGLMCRPREFMDGTVSFLLINGKGQIISERMIFIKNRKHIAEGEIQTTGNTQKREKIAINLQVTNKKVWNGSCSVAVTDNTDIRPDSCTHLLSTLLLTSDLRGHIETPAWYFTPTDDEEKSKLQNQALDVLMMTQGWRKYDLEKTWKKEYQKAKIEPEYSQTLSGKVTKQVGNVPIENAEVKIMIPNLGITESVKTDSVGRFVLNNFDAPDNTLYWVSAYTSRGKKNVVLELDTITHILPETKIPPYRAEATDSLHWDISNEYLAKADLKMLNETGIRHIFLDEVLVTASVQPEQTEYEKIMLSQSIKEEEITKSGATDVMSLIFMKASGLRLMEKKDKETGEGMTFLAMRGEAVAIILDGSILNPLIIDKMENESAINLLKTMSKDEVSQIDVIKGAQALSFHSKATGGVIAVTSKGGGKKKNAKFPTTNIKTIMPLGFQQPVAFYVPRYETVTQKENKTPDLRTTIHWQPHLEVKNGKAELEFYTADSPVDYTVIIEGVGEDGSLLRVEERIRP